MELLPPSYPHSKCSSFFSFAPGINMRIFSQVFKPLITALSRPKEFATAQLAQTAGDPLAYPARAGVSLGDAEALNRLKSRLIMDAHHEQATRSLVAKMMSQLLPQVPTHVPDLARAQQLREAKKLDALFPAVPTHIPRLKSRRNKNITERAPVSKLAQQNYRPLSSSPKMRVSSLSPAARSQRTLPSKAIIQRRLSALDNRIVDINTKIAKLDVSLARTSDPASRLRIAIERGRQQTTLTQQRSLGVKLRYLASKAGG